MLWVHVPMNWIDFLREIFKMILLFLSKDWNSVNTGSGEDVIILWPYMRSFHWNWGWKCIGKGRIMRWEKSSSLMMQLKPVSGFGASPILRPISLARQKKKNNRFYISIKIRNVLYFHWDSNCSLTVQFSSVQSLSHVQLFVTPWITARQASLSITNSRSPLRLTSIESVMPSRHLLLCRPLLLLPPIPPSIRVNSLHEVAKVLEFQL